MLRQDRLFQQELQKKYDLIDVKEVINYYNKGQSVEIDIIDYETGMESILDLKSISEEEFTERVNIAIKNRSYFGKLKC